MENKICRFSTPPKRIPKIITDATTEAISEIAKIIDVAGLGSIFIKHSEFGGFLKNITTPQSLFLSCLDTGYDGIVSSKFIKSEDFSENFENIPMDVILYSDPTIFTNGEIKTLMQEKLSSSLARRLEVIFDASLKEKFYRFSDEQEREFINKSKVLGQELFKIYSQVRPHASFRLKSDAKELYFDYKEKVIDLKNATDNSILQREIGSRDYKALKRAGRFAMINHPGEEVIARRDMAQAIIVTENLSNGLEKLLNYRLAMLDSYDKAFAFFKENLNVEFSKTDIKTIHYKKFDVPREIIRKKFDEFMETVAEIATAHGYVLNVRKAERNGCFYKLSEAPTTELSSDSAALENIITISSEPCKPCNDVQSPEANVNNNLTNLANFASDLNNTNDGGNNND